MPITVPASARAAALAAVFAVTPFVTTSAASLVSPVADRPLRSAPAAERLVPAASGPAAVSPAGGYRWPLDGAPEVVRPFDPPPRPWLPGHRGVDLAGVPGAPVYAAGTGVVRFAGQLAGRGVVSIDHPDGLRTTYEPLRPLVAAGQQVRAGDLIGALDPGHTGCPAVACLHWGLRHGDRYLDPLALLGLGRVRLLPLDGAADRPG